MEHCGYKTIAKCNADFIEQFNKQEVDNECILFYTHSQLSSLYLLYQQKIVPGVFGVMLAGKKVLFVFNEACYILVP